MPGSVSRRPGPPFFPDPAGRPLAPPPLREREPVGDHDRRRVVVEPPPAPPLEVVRPQLLLHLPGPLPDRPAAPPRPARTRLVPAGQVTRRDTSGRPYRTPPVRTRRFGASCS